ncbi:MAG: ATP-binding protein, partial [Alphaproteobacteria bacterium]
SVADNGPGIPRKTRKLIFEKFQQARETLTDKPTGTGLGLPISRQIIEYFGGEIKVASKPGKGATFSFTVPYPQAKRGRKRGAKRKAE